MTSKEIVLSRHSGARCIGSITGWDVVAEGRVIGSGISPRVAWGQAEYRTRGVSDAWQLKVQS